ncbi:MAG: hypothetical protein ABIO94_13650 [Opitutaceae bacterium]
MGYLKTILTYHRPSEAEVDKAFLESHGFNVCLLNGNTSRNELGAPFYIQLQVVEEHHARATAILREANPSRFGSPARVAELDRQIKKTIFSVLLGAIPAGALGFFLCPAPPEFFGPGQKSTADFRVPVAMGAAFFGGYSVLKLSRRLKRGATGRA